MTGSLKEDVLIAIASLGPAVLTASVYEQVNAARQSERGKGLSFAAVFNTIQRLVDDGLVDVGDGPVRRGKPMAIYTINSVGERELSRADAVRFKLRALSPLQTGGAANA